MDTGTVVSIVLMIIAVVIVFAARFYIGTFLVKRAVSQVAKIFREHNATSAANARTLDEMGLARKGMLQSVGQVRRDYKQQALQTMMDAGVVCKVEANRVYLSEDELAEYGF